MRSQFSATLIALLEEHAVDELPISIRIQNAIRRQLGNGSLKAFDRLPSTRLLAKELAVARETVEFAYQHLEAEGYLIRERGSGTFVSETGAQLAIFQVPRGGSPFGQACNRHDLTTAGRWPGSQSDSVTLREASRETQATTRCCWACTPQVTGH